MAMSAHYFGKKRPSFLWPASLLLTTLLLACAFGTGCSNLLPRIHPPAVDYDKTTESAFTRCDQNNDGAISKEEAASLPAINRRFSLYDADANGKITPEEFKDRLSAMFDPRASLVGASCYVSMGGRPLSGAVVRFVPEECMADVIPPAEGVTDEDGYSELGMATEDVPEGAPKDENFIRPGLYQVIITHPSREIPAKYNQESTLGEDVSRETIMSESFRFALEGS